jgi:hypothetical protein
MVLEAGSLRSGCGHDWIRMATFSLAEGRERKHTPFSCSCKGTNPSRGPHLHDPITFQGSIIQYHCLGGRVSTSEFGRIQTCSPQQHGLQGQGQSLACRWQPSLATVEEDKGEGAGTRLILFFCPSLCHLTASRQLLRVKCSLHLSTVK